MQAPHKLLAIVADVLIGTFVGIVMTALLTLLTFGMVNPLFLSIASSIMFAYAITSIPAVSVQYVRIKLYLMVTIFNIGSFFKGLVRRGTPVVAV